MTAPRSCGRPAERPGGAHLDMRAIRHGRHGGPDVLESVEVDDPQPGPGDLLIEVRACAINRLDLLQRQGPPVVAGFTLPHVPGMDIAGTVIEAGAEVDGWSPGEEVVLDPVTTCGRCELCCAGRPAHCAELRTLGSTRWGGYAEQVVAPAGNARRIPASMSFVEAASLPVAFVTAWVGVTEVGRVAPGEAFCVMGAGSAVTIAALRLARRAGAGRLVTTAGSDATVERARVELGADVEVVDRRGDGLVERLVEASGGTGYDVIMDHVGPAQLQTQVDALALDGRMVLSGTTTGTRGELDLPSLYHRGRSLLGLGGAGPTTFDDMFDAVVDDPSLRMVIDDVMDLDEAAEAHRRIERGDFFGKIVLVPAGA